VLIASRHESTFDVLFWIAMLPAACFVVKRELAQIPLFGRCIRAVGMISVDREAKGTAMRTLLRGGVRAKAEGRHIIIFPEGTRVDPDEYPPLQPGVAALASRTGLQVVPVMTDSGRYWGRRAFRKLPGTIRIVVQPPLAVPPGREAMLAALRAAFEPGKLVDKSVGGE
jgi:1-acyl-sn-glycerol-3-phosphate acyltransferase